jgi:two-component system LytT family response regulator
MRALLVDDEDLARENLRMMLQDYCPNIEVIGTASSVGDAKLKITQLNPDVVFLDIRMPSGEEGFELLAQIPADKFLVVFVTAFKEFAVRAFKTNAIHYLLKPIDIEDLIQANEKLQTYQQLFDQNPDNFKQYLETIQNLTQSISNNSSQRITIQHSKGFKIVDDHSIVRLQADGNCSKLYFKDESKYLDTRTLKTYESILDPNKFFRIHKSHIVNLDYLIEYISDDGYYVKLTDGELIPVARSRVAEFMITMKNSSKK